VPRLARGVAIGVALAFVVGTGGVVAHAQEAELPAEITATAATAGVDPVDLAGAMASEQEAGFTGSPLDYLRAVGEVPQPYTPPMRAVAVAAPFGLSPYLARVASCESIGFNPYYVYGPGRGRQGEIGLFQLKPGGMLTVFYAWGFTNPWNPWQQAAFATKAFALGYGSRWSCA
jgi:hypothetical protein